MKWKERLVLPAIFATILLGWIAWETREAKSVQEDRLRLPDSNDSMVLLEFMRQTHVDALQESWPIEDVEAVLRKATERLQEQLSPGEVLPPFAELCDLKYRLMHAIKVERPSDAKVERLTEDVLQLASQSNRFTSNQEDTMLFFDTMSFALVMLESQPATRQGMLDFTDSLRAALDGSDEILVTWWREKTLAGFTRRVGLLGQQFQLVSNTLVGQPFDLADLRGKIVLVEFWSVNCEPCVAEMPLLKAVRDRHEQFEVVGICRDRSKRRLREFLEARQITWPQLWHDPQLGNLELAESLGLTQLPSSILVDPQGTVVALNVRVESDEDSLENWLDRLEN